MTTHSGSDGREAPALVAAECGGAADRRVDVGLLVAHAPGSDPDRLRSFASRAAADAVDELAAATDVGWRFRLEDPAVGFVDLVRTGAFISAVGVLPGALAGGLENRTIVGHLALFPDEP